MLWVHTLMPYLALIWKGKWIWDPQTQFFRQFFALDWRHYILMKLKYGTEAYTMPANLWVGHSCR